MFVRDAASLGVYIPEWSIYSRARAFPVWIANRRSIEEYVMQTSAAACVGGRFVEDLVFLTNK